MHWLHALITWHKVNVLGNIVASIEMGVILLLVGRPVWRRARRRAAAALRDHIAEQVDRHVTPLHHRLDQLLERVVNPDDQNRPPTIDP